MTKLTPEQQVRQLRTEALKPGAEDIEAMNNRVIALEQLYQLSGRANPNHTMHSRTTGLWAQTPDTLP
jgi:hypothetical protein